MENADERRSARISSELCFSSVGENRVEMPRLLASSLPPCLGPGPQGAGRRRAPSQIVVTQLHIFLRRLEDRLEVHEFYLISNTGDQIYIGREDPRTGRRHALAFALPADAADLQVLEPAEEHWVRIDGGIACTDPISPGNLALELAFQYALPFAEGMEVERTFPVRVASLGVMVLGGNLGVESRDLTAQGVMDTGQGPIRVYTAGPLEAGQPVRFRVRTEPLEAALAPTGSASAAPPIRNPTAEVAIRAGGAGGRGGGGLRSAAASGPGPRPDRGHCRAGRGVPGGATG